VPRRCSCSEKRRFHPNPSSRTCHAQPRMNLPGSNPLAALVGCWEACIIGGWCGQAIGGKMLWVEHLQHAPRRIPVFQFLPLLDGLLLVRPSSQPHHCGTTAPSKCVKTRCIALAPSVLPCSHCVASLSPCADCSSQGEEEESGQGLRCQQQPPDGSASVPSPSLKGAREAAVLSCRG